MTPSASGTITATFTWNRAAGNPPAYVYVKEKCFTQAQSYSPGVLPQANNSLGSPTLTTTAYVSGSTKTTVTCDGARISRIDTGGSNTFTVTASPSASGTFGIDIAYSAAVVTKFVSIESSIDESFHRGTNGLPESDMSNVATPRFGDTWVDPLSFILGDPRGVVYKAPRTFTAVPIGAWMGPSHTWVTSQAEINSFTDNLFGTFTSISPTFEFTKSQLTDMGRSGPVTIPVELTLTDHGDGVEGQSEKAVYNVIFHNQYEKWRTIQTLDAKFIFPTLDVANPGFAVYNGGIAATWTETEGKWSEMAGTIDNLHDILSPFITDPRWAACFELAHIGIQEAVPKPSNGTAMFNSCWGDPYSTISGGTWSDDKSRFKMTPRLQITYSTVLQNCDQYGLHGYEGIACNVIGRKDGFRWIGNFARFGY